MKPRLGVNIDHVATLRQARGEDYPNLIKAAQVVIQNGADQITIHLREDRRHIQEKDVGLVKEITKKFNIPLNLEIACSHEIFEITNRYQPQWVCIVPEKREERTTEGGLDLLNPDAFGRISKTCKELKKEIPGLKISLFLEPNKKVLELAKEIPIDAVEIHTGEYAKLFNTGSNYQKLLPSFKEAYLFLKETKIACHAGHGLTLDNVLPLLNEGYFEEYNIGHFIVADSIFRGLGPVVREFSDLFGKHVVKEEK